MTTGSIRQLARYADQWWYGDVPARRLATIRILVGGFAVVYLTARLGHLLSYASFAPELFAPVGPVRILDTPLPRQAAGAIPVVTLLLAVAFTLGWRFRICGPMFGIALLWTLSYRNSFGRIFHTDNLLVIHTLILGLLPAGRTGALDTLRAPTTDDREPVVSAWGLRLMSTTTVLAYVVAGVAKLRNAGLYWVSEDVLRNYVAYDNLRKLQLGSIYSPLGGYLVGRRWFWPPLAVLTLLLELGAPVALLSQRIAAIWALGAYSFHLGVLALMAIVFPYQLCGVAYASFFRIERWRPVRFLWTRAIATRLASPDRCKRA